MKNKNLFFILKMTKLSNRRFFLIKDINLPTDIMLAGIKIEMKYWTSQYPNTTITFISKALLTSFECVSGSASGQSLRWQFLNSPVSQKTLSTINMLSGGIARERRWISIRELMISINIFQQQSWTLQDLLWPLSASKSLMTQGLKLNSYIYIGSTKIWTFFYIWSQLILNRKIRQEKERQKKREKKGNEKPPKKREQ